MEYKKSKNKLIRAGLAVKINPEDIPATADDLLRYAGGSGYRPDDEKRKTAEDILEYAYSIVRPAFVYAIHERDSSCYAEFASNFYFQGKNGRMTDSLAAAVCTIGPVLENKVSELMVKGKALDALFLDAAGVAALESLSDEAFSHLKRKALEKGLFSCGRIEPGCGDVPIGFQKSISEYLDPEIIGVTVNESGFLVPLKSLSFLVVLSAEPADEGTVGKCRNCGLKNCAYRIVAPL